MSLAEDFEGLQLHLTIVFSLVHACFEDASSHLPAPVTMDSVWFLLSPQDGLSLSGTMPDAWFSASQHDGLSPLWDKINFILHDWLWVKAFCHSKQGLVNARMVSEFTFCTRPRDRRQWGTLPHPFSSDSTACSLMHTSDVSALWDARATCHGR